MPLLEESVEILGGLSGNAALAEGFARLARAREQAGAGEAADTWAEVRRLKNGLDDRPGVLQAIEHEARLRSEDPEQMVDLHRSGLALALELGDTAAQARIRNSLAITAWKSGNPEEALGEYERAAEALRDGGSREGLGVVFNGLGAVLTRLGRHEDASSVLEDALRINREADNVGREADTLAALGAVARAAGDSVRAYDRYQACLDRRRTALDRRGEGWALLRLAELSDEAGASERATGYAGEALAIALEIADAALEEACARVAPEVRPIRSR